MQKKISTTISLIKKQVRTFALPIVSEVAERTDPYLILISCILSLRTQDKTTAQASSRLFEVADTPGKMARLTEKRIEKLIYPVGFYRTKARVIRQASERIIRDFEGSVPRTHEELLSIKGVGRKTANLVLGLGFGIPAVCVDTHVHRISNRLGWVKTRDPRETEEALERLLPRKRWIEINTLLVTFGQNICQPVSPWCSRCQVRPYCRRVGVTRSR